MKKWTERLAAAALAAILLVSPAFAAGGRFSDVPEDYWGYAHIEQAAAQGWVNGNGDGTFSPDRELSGAAVCAIGIPAVSVLALPFSGLFLVLLGFSAPCLLGQFLARVPLEGPGGP